MNTKKSGKLTFFIYKDVSTDTYVGACLELCIVKESEDANKLKCDLEEAAKGFVEAVVKKNLPDDLLNQKPPQEISDMLRKCFDMLLVESTQSGLVKRNDFEFVSVSTEPVSELCHVS